MTNCTTAEIEFSSLKRHKVTTEFSGGEITSDGGALLLHEADRQLNLMKQVSDVVDDPHRQDMVQHTQLSMLRQRVYGLALGYEDLNDHQELRKDSAIQGQKRGRGGLKNLNRSLSGNPVNPSGRIAQ